LRMFGAFVYWYMRAVPAGIALARRVNPDVVFGMGALGSVAGYLVARVARVPNVTRFFGSELQEIMGNPFRLVTRYREIIPYAFAASYYIMHNDGSGGDRVAVKYGVPPDRIFYWPNGTDKELYLRERDVGEVARRFGIPPDSVVVMTASRLHPQLHVDRLIEAAPEIVRQRDDAYFLITGEGEEEERLKELALSLGVSDRVVFTGAFSREEMADAYGLASVFVSLSDRTNMSNPLDEAMMSGLAVVVLNSGTTGDVVHDDVNGVLLERDDLPRLGRVIAALMGDRERMKRLGERARRDADERLPSFQERQAMEVGAVERAVRERR